MTFLLKMPVKLRCPLCDSDEMIDIDGFINCPSCQRTWNKEILLKKIQKDHILSEEELSGFSNIFDDELKDPKRRRGFLKSIDKDLI